MAEEEVGSVGGGGSRLRRRRFAAPEEEVRGPGGGGPRARGRKILIRMKHYVRRYGGKKEVGDLEMVDVRC